jgi:hypothetical protein
VAVVAVVEEEVRKCQEQPLRDMPKARAPRTERGQADEARYESGVVIRMRRVEYTS